jgi:hypothetical protein
MFENVMNSFHTKYPAVTTIHSETPLQKEERIFQNSLSQLKKISPQIKGTKLKKMLDRYEKEKKYLYI